LYYVVGETEKIHMADFVKDDMATADAAVTEPVYPVSPEYPYSWNYDSDEEYDAAYAEYESALAEYEMQETEYWEKLELFQEKESRDALREELKNYTEEITEYTLCYFDGKEAMEVLPGMANSWIYDYALDAAVATVFVQEAGEDLQMKLSEITSVWDVSSRFYEERNAIGQQYMVIGEKSYPISLEDADILRISDDGKHLRYIVDLDEEDKEGSVYRAQIKNDGLGEAELLDDDVYAYNIFTLDDGSLVYFKDVDTEENVGDLYIDGQEADEEVCLDRVVYAEELGGVLYFTDWDNYDTVGTLKLYKNKKGEKLSDDVYSYYINQSGELVYLYDYSQRHYTGSLYIYNGGKAKRIDDDVTALIPDASLYQVMHGYNIW